MPATMLVLNSILARGSQAQGSAASARSRLAGPTDQAESQEIEGQETDQRPEMQRTGTKTGGKHGAMNHNSYHRRSEKAECILQVEPSLTGGGREIWSSTTRGSSITMEPLLVAFE